MRLIAPAVILYPDEPAYRLELATALRHQGRTLRDRGKIWDARAAYARAAGLYEDLRQASPEDRRLLQMHANTLANWSTVLLIDGEMTEAEALCRQAIALLESLAPQVRNRSILLDLALTLDELGYTLRIQKRLDESEDSSSKALAIRQRLLAEQAVKQARGEADYWNSLALAQLECQDARGHCLRREVHFAPQVSQSVRCADPRPGPSPPRPRRGGPAPLRHGVPRIEDRVPTRRIPQPFRPRG
jgi:tetratricopeptide (TPR) repeat protein